jgi:carbon catabolite-derepressing protein kinase
MSDTPSLLRNEVERPRISNIKVLNTSIPHVHGELMQLRNKAARNGEDPDLVFHPIQTQPKEPDPKAIPTIAEEVKDEDGNPIYRSKEEQEATSKALKPHSRSVTALNGMGNLPERMTQLPHDDKKASSARNKSRKWQFGIRSRNAPYEAMKCLFNALKEVGADWEIVPASDFDNIQEGDDEKEGLPPPPPELAPGERHTILQRKYSFVGQDYYVARDPWKIRARLLKKGMLMPGEEPSMSANSSAVSLPAEARKQLKRHMEQLGEYTSDEVASALGMNGSQTKAKSPFSSSNPSRQNTGPRPETHGHDAFTGPGTVSRTESLVSSTKKASDKIGVWVFVDIQLYALEQTVYVVDFKCDGYQNVIWHEPKRAKSPTTGSSSAFNTPTTSRPASGMGHVLHHGTSLSEDGGEEDGEGYWKPTSKRYKNVEKNVSSPYPYLDVASDLVAQLASAPAG